MPRPVARLGHALQVRQMGRFVMSAGRQEQEKRQSPAGTTRRTGRLQGSSGKEQLEPAR